MTNPPASPKPQILEIFPEGKEWWSGSGRLSFGPRGLASLVPSDLRRGDQSRQVPERLKPPCGVFSYSCRPRPVLIVVGQT